MAGRQKDVGKCACPNQSVYGRFPYLPQRRLAGKGTRSQEDKECAARPEDSLPSASSFTMPGGNRLGNGVAGGRRDRQEPLHWLTSGRQEQRYLYAFPNSSM